MANIQTTLTVRGMTCGGCEKSVERALKSVPGVISAQASRDREQVAVEYNPEQTAVADLHRAVEQAGYTVA
ncbi:MAG: copper chaperone [Candidatus Zixiibacteriota bacterium]|nr:MAG: copper chaperone [candidate division Zixibacteria bacterium]